MNVALIVAAGKGTRMGPGRDKLFLDLNGRPVIAHTWKRFDDADCIDAIVLVVREGMQTDFARIGKEFGFRKPVQFAAGGAERQDSVWNGLEALPAGAEIVAIQDGARPCTPMDVIRRTLSAAQEVGAAVAAQRITDTVKESMDGKLISRHLDRKLLWAVQTPQTFRVSVIREALAAVRAQGLSVTDDTAACEAIGQSVQLIESVEPNPKVTLPSDIPYICQLLDRESTHD
jgi:2-C-methyl-D-erythritol 4-phosphate cytidylyltransferase